MNRQPMPGNHVGTIRRHTLEEIGTKGTPGLVVEVELDDGNTVRPVIWMTEASMRMARQQLRLCGFDPDTEDLSSIAGPLSDNLPAEAAYSLYGRRVPVRVFFDDRNKLKAEIASPKKDRADESAVARLQDALRGAASAARSAPKEPAPAPAAAPGASSRVIGWDTPSTQPSGSSSVDSYAGIGHAVTPEVLEAARNAGMAPPPRTEPLPPPPADDEIPF